MKNSILIIILSLLTLSNSATRNIVEDLFGDLYAEEIYSGYLKTKREGDELFYMYIPAINNPHIAPIMLWLNGGPGCSSLFGLLAEVGPVTSDNYEGKFKVNPYSWNKDVNLLVIEQPAGVGFSKVNDPKFVYNDDIMGENLLFAIKDFLAEYSMKNREFYVSGESYAGVYIPTLATYMLNDNSEDKVNLKGVLIGNGLTDYDTDVERSMVEFGFWHGMISPETFNLFKKHCPHKSDELHPEEESSELKDGFYPRNVTHRCNKIREEIRNNLDGSDIYGIYRLCPKGNQITSNNPLFYNSKNTYRKTILEKLKKKDKYLKELEPEDDVWPNGCNEDLFFDVFLNNETIKTKLAVDTSIIWTQCWGGLNYDMGESFKFYSETMLKFPDLKVWVFSGTEDGVLSTLGTMRWINKLNFTIENEWTQYKVNEQVAGFAQKYKEGLVIVTVKGAGHMVPQDQRASAYKMYDSFIKGILPFEE
jgi:carboxypeptidase C (cathepsin A)